MARGLKWLVLRRVVGAVPLVFIVILINFAITRMSPGDPAVFVAGPDAPREAVEMLRHEMGLDKPLYVQLYLYIAQIVRGDLGKSFVYYRPVLAVILEKLPNTLLLMTFAYSISVLMGMFMGVLASKNPYSKTDSLAQVISLVAYSTPEFWVGMVFILVFAWYLGLFPVAGMVTPGLTGLDYVVDLLQHLLLPGLVLGLCRLALIMRLTRSSMLEELGRDYILTAWSKGCDEKAVYYEHALRNALLPVITVLGMDLPYLFTGAILVEIVFAWPGIGRLINSAIFQFDHNMLMGIFFIVSIFVIAGNLLADVAYALVDPRIRYK